MESLKNIHFKILILKKNKNLTKNTIFIFLDIKKKEIFL